MTDDIKPVAWAIFRDGALIGSMTSRSLMSRSR
jgi:hypothetical protein